MNDKYVFKIDDTHGAGNPSRPIHPTFFYALGNGDAVWTHEGNQMGWEDWILPR
jgi:hypothetical protein